LPIFGLTITLLIYAIGAIAVVIFPIFTLDQNFATKILETGNNYSPIHTLILGIFIAPAVEEIIFRGFLMNRIGRKFGIKAGIILSSAIFALGHSIFFLGAFVIGITFCLIYIKTKTLIVPMTAHIFYNSLVWLAGLASQDIGGFSSEYWIQFIYQGLIAMTITSPIIFITMIRWWPSNSTKIPYHSNR
jgi:membrane protease YdiL (CAAX protease family)